LLLLKDKVTINAKISRYAGVTSNSVFALDSSPRDFQIRTSDMQRKMRAGIQMYRTAKQLTN